MIQIHRNNLQYFCRTCLEQLQSGASNYHIGQTPNLTKLLIICTSLSIKNDEDAVYPQWLCKKCYDMLQHIRHFREMTLRSADVLHKIVKDSSDHTNATTSTTSDGYFHDSGYTANQDVKIEVGATHMLENYCRNEKADNFDEFILDSDSSAPSTSTAKKRKQINEIDGKFGCRIVGCYEKFKNHKTLEAHMKLEHASVENVANEESGTPNEQKKSTSRDRMKRYREKIKLNPELYKAQLEKNKNYQKKYWTKLKTDPDKCEKIKSSTYARLKKWRKKNKKPTEDEKIYFPCPDFT